jgi:hypothetical protein
VKTRSYANLSESCEARVAFAPFGGRYIDTVFTVGCVHAVEPGQVYPGLGYQRCQLGDEIKRFEDYVRGAIAVRRF